MRGLLRSIVISVGNVGDSGRSSCPTSTVKRIVLRIIWPIWVTLILMVYVY
ncbi:hypothetical protein LINGRAHAP2_LOCUS26162 [Linum grandiflorum]